MSYGSGQDAAGWTTYADCEDIFCDFENWVYVEYRDGAAGWTCPFCDRRNEADVPGVS